MPGQFIVDEDDLNKRPQGAATRLDTSGKAPERGLQLPYVKDPKYTWQYYNCWIECYLDSGLVVHRALPQSDYDADSLGALDMRDAAFDVEKALGVNTRSNGNFTDVTQRMANSRYWFCLKGAAIRVAYQIPIPKIVGTLGGVPAIPCPMGDRPEQFAYNKLVENYCGIPVFLAEWELWYTLAQSPAEAIVPPPNLAAHMRADTKLIDGVQVPETVEGQDSVSTVPTLPPLLNPIR